MLSLKTKNCERDHEDLLFYQKQWFLSDLSPILGAYLALIGCWCGLNPDNMCLKQFIVYRA